MKLQKPKAILFDWDNTLADTWPIIHSALSTTFKEMDMTPWTIEDVKKNVHKSMRDSFPEIFGDGWKKASEIYYDNFLKNHLTHLRTLPDAEIVLSILSDTDIFVAVVSNKTGKHLRNEVKHVGWENYFSKVVGATDAEADKPSAAPVLLALLDTNIKPAKDVWFIGDSITDLDCAINTGCQPIFFGDHEIPKGYEKHPKYSAPLIHVKNHKELIKLIEDF